MAKRNDFPDKKNTAAVTNNNVKTNEKVDKNLELKKVSYPMIHIRRDPSTSAEVIGKLRAGDLVFLLEDFGNWYLIETVKEPKIKGYCMSDFFVHGDS